MSAMPDNIVPFTLPKKPRIKEKEPAPDQRKICVMPIRALTDRSLSDAAVRVLGILCSYCNRAGLTWVSQTRLAKDMNVSKQAISKQVVKLKAAGYVEVVKKGFRGERTDTIRVVFDESIDVETALAVTSRHEDNRPPALKEEQMKEQQDMTVDREGLKRIQDMIKGTLKPINPPAKEYQMPKGDTQTVAKMKADIATKKASRSRPIDNSKVVNTEPSIDNHNDNLEVVPNTENIDISKSLRSICFKDLDLSLIKVIDNQLSSDEQEATLQKLQDRCQAEGVAMPTGADLIESLLVLHADSL
jgi:DNA-binding transcriptional regulator GbsR (MarR family)